MSVADVGDPVPHRFIDGVFQVRLPESTATPCAPSRRMRATLSAWRAMSSVPMYTTHSASRCAATVAEAAVLPCAGFRNDARLAHFDSKQARLMALLILCAPVWSRSSRLR